MVFRLRAGDNATRELHERILSTGRIFCSSTRLDGLLTLRLCVLSHRTHRAHVDEALDIIQAQLR